jgi:uncharacterized protein (TIGR03067 family)
MPCLVLLAMTVGSLHAADEPGDVLRALQGDWKVVMVTVNGSAIPEAEYKAGSLTIAGDSYRLKFPTNQTASTIRLDPSKSPATIDYTFNTGPQKGQTAHGIYKLEGGTLTVCRGLSEVEDRPTRFESSPDSGLLLVVWKRTKSAEDPAVREELARFQGTWQLLTAETDGKKIDEDQAKQIRVTMTGNTHTVRFGDRVIAENVRFAIDPSKTPRWTTDAIDEGPDKGKEMRGIYRLEGDRLTSCVAKVGGERPTEFSAKPGSGQTLRTFVRVKDKDAS